MDVLTVNRCTAYWINYQNNIIKLIVTYLLALTTVIRSPSVTTANSLEKIEQEKSPDYSRPVFLSWQFRIYPSYDILNNLISVNFVKHFMPAAFIKLIGNILNPNSFIPLDQ